jgi:hypothetical protein
LSSGITFQVQQISFNFETTGLDKIISVGWGYSDALFGARRVMPIVREAENGTSNTTDIVY